MRKTSPRRELVTVEILDQAAALFAVRGFSGTTLQDVADSMKVSRAALYHYFTSKEDLLAQLVRGITRDIADRLSEIRRSDAAPVEKVSQGFREIALRAALSPARFVLLDRSDGDLPEQLAREHRAARRDIREHWTAIIREGVESGAFRPVDERMAAYGLLGMSTWIAWWYRPDLGFTPEEVADSLTAMAVRSLLAEGHGSGDGVDAAFAALRENLTYLERVLATRRGGEPAGQKRAETKPNRRGGATVAKSINGTTKGR